MELSSPTQSGQAKSKDPDDDDDNDNGRQLNLRIQRTTQHTISKIENNKNDVSNFQPRALRLLCTVTSRQTEGKYIHLKLGSREKENNLPEDDSQ